MAHERILSRLLLTLLLLIAVAGLTVTGQDVNVGLQTLTDKVEALTKEVEDVKLLINNLTLGSLDLRSSLETELRHLEQVVEDTKDTTNSLERKVESLDNKIMDQGQGISLEVRRLTAKVNDMKNKIEESDENEIETLNSLADKMDDIQDKLASEMAGLETKLTGLQDEVSNSKNCTLSLSNTMGRDMQWLQADLARVGTTVATLQTDVNSTTNVLKEIGEHVRSNSREIAAMRQESAQRALEQSRETQEVASELRTMQVDAQEHHVAMVNHFGNTSTKGAATACHSSREQGEITNSTAVRYLPASCSEIASLNPTAPSGHYWVREASGVSAVSVYCDMTRHCCGTKGGWMRAAYLNMADLSQQCPEGFELRTDPKRVCGRKDGPACASILISTPTMPYSRVCGRTRAYQYSTPYAFNYYYYFQSTTIDGAYVDGLSLTHGASSRQHIWTFAAALDETVSNNLVCPCSKTDSVYTGRLPPFIGNDYFCDTGSRNHAKRGTFYHEDPLWDGEGCGPTNSCCQFNSPPWFCKELSGSTTDDLEIRVCSSGGSTTVLLDLIELYIQ